MNMDWIFGSGGILSKLLPGYSPRPGQIAMANSVEASLRNEKHLIAEGFTGTGKSLAYGIPVALHARKNGTAAIIVTANIALQEQLVNKDLPLIRKVLEETGLSFSFALMKGVNNYLCQMRLKAEMKKTTADWLNELSLWASETKTGDKSELPGVYENWWRVACDHRDCLKDHCPMLQLGRCFKTNARKEAKQANVVVANYHLLYSGFLKSKDLLPKHSVIVMDEAHEAVDKAREFLGWELKKSDIKWIADKVAQLGKGYEVSKILLSGSEVFFNSLKGKENRVLAHDIPDMGLIGALAEASRIIDIRVTSFKDIVEDGKDFEQFCRAKAYISAIEEHRTHLRSACYSEHRHPESVYYVESGPVLKCKRIEVQSLFREFVFTGKTSISTSATLSTNGNFNFVVSQLGLKPSEYSAMIAPTPFDPERVLAVIPDKLPMPNAKAWPDEVIKVIEDTVNSSKGRTMALFTSYRMLDICWNSLKKRLPGVSIFAQGHLPQMKIVEEFKNCWKEGKPALILATKTFWQGVDIPGEALSCLVIDKLPFLPPSDPVLHYLEENGYGNSFYDYQIPQAIIQLKQGVGRLIRTEDDYGAVVVCDVRIEKKGYGEQFITAFPDGCFRSGRIDDIEDFFGRFEERAEQSLGHNQGPTVPDKT